jgi:hypothetical protein
MGGMGKLEFRVVALGDCNTGRKIKYEGPKRIYHAWADVVGYELPHITLISRGKSGDKWQGMWRRWKEDVLDEKPDVVIINFPSSSWPTRLKWSIRWNN